MQCVQHVLVSPGAAAPQGPVKSSSAKIHHTHNHQDKLTPRRQTFPRTEAQLQIRIRLTRFNLAARRLFPKRKHDTLTTGITRLDRQRPPRKPITKYVRQIVPDLSTIEIVTEDRLADVGLEKAVGDGRDFECDAPGLRVAVENFAVGGVFGDGDLGSDAAADRPQVDSLVAVIGYDCAA